VRRVLARYQRERLEGLLKLPWVDPEVDLQMAAELVTIELQLQLVQAYCAKYGLVSVDSLGTVDPQPVQRLAVALRKQLISLSDRLGLSPLSRKRLQSRQPEPVPVADLAAMLGGDGE